MNNKQKILVVAGPSGGHVYPAIAFIERLNDKCNHPSAYLILPGSYVKKIPPVAGCALQYINIPSVKLEFGFENIKKAAKLINGCIESFFILIKYRPDIVVGFGSIVSAPFIIFSWLLRIETVIHEQNVIPGRANKLLVMFADKIAVSFETTMHYFKNYRRKITVTGNPLRKKITRLDKTMALGYLGLDAGKFTILVMGGSQGSGKINAEFVDALSLLNNRSFMQVVHLSGRMDFERLKQRYEKLDIKFRIFDFFDSIEYLYSAADLTVSRAGATSIAEIIFYELPAILIPYPYAYKHQYMNAKALEEKGCAVIREEEKLNAVVLKDDIELFLRSRNRLADMQAAYGKFPKTDAAELLLNSILIRQGALSN